MAYEAAERPKVATDLKKTKEGEQQTKAAPPEDAKGKGKKGEAKDTVDGHVNPSTKNCKVEEVNVVMTLVPKG